MEGRSTAEIVRLTLLYTAVLLLAAFSRPTWWSVLAGGALVALGEAVRVWAAGHLFKTQQLVTSGPYRYTRNPLYLGRLLIVSGVALMAWFGPRVNLALLAAFWLVFFGYYMPRKERIEPRRLARLHGDAYREYRDGVPALFPRRSGWPTGTGHWRLERFRRNREHWMVAGLALMLVIFAARAWRS